MLTLLLYTIGTSITLWLCPNNKIWATLIAQSSLGWLLTNIILISPNQAFSHNSWLLNTDYLSNCLLNLSFWLIPVALIASINHLNENNINIKSFIQLCLIILFSLILTFSATQLILLFIGFEMTLIPTLFLIGRWGAQEERIEAGSYFVFYTLTSSLPLFIALLIIYSYENHNTLGLFTLTQNLVTPPFITLFCLIAFLVKVPIFGLHLWLPKAHVEAPVAGSMILASILLKMGGYGFIRLTTTLQPYFNNISPYLISFCCWGGLLTSLICLTQSDLKSLIAYSSVSHMSLMIAGVASLSAWSITGCLIVMISHGIISSGLFYTANLHYERSGSRTLLINRSIKNAYSALPLLWLILACGNMSLPPLPSGIGEIIVLTTIISHSLINFIPAALGGILTAIFSLGIYQTLNSGYLHNQNTSFNNLSERELLGLTLHLLPMFALIIFPTLLTAS